MYSDESSETKPDLKVEIITRKLSFLRDQKCSSNNSSYSTFARGGNKQLFVHILAKRVLKSGSDLQYNGCINEVQPTQCHWLMNASTVEENWKAINDFTTIMYEII